MIYEGEWKHGKKHGYAREIMGQQSCYEGYFKDGDRHGEGIETHRDYVRKGYWENNVFTGISKFNDRTVEVGLFPHSLFKGAIDITLPSIKLYKGKIEQKSTIPLKFKLKELKC